MAQLYHLQITWPWLCIEFCLVFVHSVVSGKAFRHSKWIGDELTDAACTYLKDFGAATASNGAVGLYHIDNLTPEAKEQGESLLVENAKTYVIDDAELQRVYDSYPVIWNNMIVLGGYGLNYAPSSSSPEMVCQSSHPQYLKM